MKLLLKICLLVLYTNIIYGQINKSELIGIWQFGSKELSSGWLENYQFFSDGRFCFNTSQYDGVNRVVSIMGRFKLNKDTLILKITKSKELRGGVFVRSETLGGSGWVIEGGKIITIKYKNPKSSILVVEKCDKVGDIPCILIDKLIHYKLENDPSNYN